MGMYTDFCFKADLKPDTPTEVIDLLEFMAKGGDSDGLLIPDHPLFGDTRWEWMLHAEVGGTWLDRNRRNLVVRSRFKNYDGEIDHFLDWITPYLDVTPGRFLGYSHYEEDDLPMLIYASKESQ